MSALQYMQEMVDSGHYRETDGPNRSPAIDLLCETFGVPLGSSWCALFVSEAFRRASKEPGIKFHYTAGSQDLLAWFAGNGWTSKRVDDLFGWRGALIIRTDPGGKHGHVALVKGRMSTSGHIVALDTLEGNTNLQGEPNGDGAYERRRSIPLTPYTWTFCNTSELAGGSWWPPAP